MKPAFHMVVYKDNLGQVGAFPLKDSGIPAAKRSQFLHMAMIAEEQLGRGAPDFSGLDNSETFTFDTGILLGSDDEYHVFVDMNLMSTLKNVFRRNPHVAEARAMLKDVINQANSVTLIAEMHRMITAKNEPQEQQVPEEG